MILTRFDDGGGLDDGVVVTAAAIREGRALRLRYELRGDLGRLSIPQPATAPRRTDGLWHDTCCEAFIAAAGQASYREVNVSPAGDWNVYRFQEYRKGGAPDPAVTALPVTVATAGGSLTIDVVLAVAPGPLEVGLTAVVRAQNGRLGYWALRHDGAKPDFHLRSSFVLAV